MLEHQNRRKLIPHDLGADVDLLFMADDNGHRLYQVQVNRRVDGEMILIDKDTDVLIRIVSGTRTASDEGIDILAPKDALTTAVHTDLERLYPACSVTWFNPVGTR